MADYTFDDGAAYEPEYWAGNSGGAGAWDLSGYGTQAGGTPYSMNINDYTTPPGNWYQDTGQAIGGSDSAGSGWGSSILGALGSVGSFLGQHAGTLGPLLSGAGSLAGGAIGSNAANEAARLQAQALNRGIDLQTAQWLQQQGNLAPYLQAGQQGLATLQSLAGREQPQVPGATAAVGRGMYEMDMPNATPGWNPQDYYGPEAVQAGAFSWNPQHGPQAQDFRYTPGTIPSAATYRYTPGAVPTLSGQELLAQDPGVQFRLDASRHALEGSAAARGDLLSGGNLKALQSRAQDLASQEYGNAWNRASQQAQLREQWAQQAGQQNFGQAMSEAQMREQVQQIASQQGWSQAQAEAVFREQMAQQASQQGFNQALGAQGQQFTQGLQQAQWNQGQEQQFAQERYRNMLEQAKFRYGADVTQNQTEYDRQQAAYRQQLAQYLLPWEQSSTLTNLGGQATSMYGSQGAGAASGISGLLAQLGSAQAGGTTNQANAWMNTLQNVGNAGQGYLQQNALLSALSTLNR